MTRKNPVDEKFDIKWMYLPSFTFVDTAFLLLWGIAVGVELNHKNKDSQLRRLHIQFPDTISVY